MKFRSGRAEHHRRLLPALALLFVAAVAIACAGRGARGDDASSPEASPETATTAPSPTAGATAPSAGAGLVTPQAGQAQISSQDLQRESSAAPRGAFSGQRLIIPAIDVNASITTLVVPPDGQMPSPDGPEEAAWYDFSGWPGKGGIPGVGGNSVFSGHVDYRNYGPAVFWRLRELAPGDAVEVRTQDGATIRYEVRWSRSVDPKDPAWNDIVAATAQESLTLITCDGTWDGERREYDRRLVVWAERVA